VFEQDQFPYWLRKLNLSERAENLIQQITSSNPARLDNKTPVFATCPFRISLRRENDIAFA